MTSMTDFHSKRVTMTYRAEPTRPGWGVLASIIAATVLTALLGSVASLDAPEFYQTLAKPSWAPPAWVFGPAWTILFVLMAASAWLVVKGRALSSSRAELTLYGVQLVLNAAWTWLFFHWHLGAAAFVEVLILLAMVVITARAFHRVKPLAGWLMAPYIVWVSFASALTFSVWQGNPGVL